MMKLDLHTHSIASGHASTATITDIAKTAHANGLSLVGLSDHAPATLCAGKPSYFQSLSYAPRVRCGIPILYGVELNILDFDGRVDLDNTILEKLDYAILSMHTANIRPGSISQNTNAYIQAMKHAKVKIIGHCDDVSYPVDYKSILDAAMAHNIVFEINNISLSPEGYRGDTLANNTTILKLCAEKNYPVILGSDSHGTEHIGDFGYALDLIKRLNFPKHLILNTSVESMLNFLKINI